MLLPKVVSIRKILWAVLYDFNADFNRHNANDVYLKDLLTRKDCIICWELPCAKVDYTYNNLHYNSFSRIDHFFLTQHISHCVQNVFVHDCALNMSGHRPLVMKLDCTLARIQETENCAKSKVPPVAWHRLSENEISIYKHNLDRLLHTLPKTDLMSCCGLQCSDEKHKQQIDTLCDSLVKVCLEANNCLPKVSNKKSKRMPGWNDIVKPYRDECQFWFQLWCNNGKPHNGDIFQQMKSSKKQYMYAIRRCKRQESQLRYQKMAVSIADNNSRDLFKELKRINSSKRQKICSINNVTDPKQVADIFAKKYDSLFNSVPSDGLLMEKIQQDIAAGVQVTPQADAAISVDTIIEAVSYLKEGKSDGDQGLMSDNIINAPQTFFEKLAELFCAILKHGYQPKTILRSVLYSIPKDSRGNLHVDSNYRGIVLASAISKIFDIVLLLRNKKNLVTSNLQFAFKKSLGTTICTQTVKEIIKYYMANKSQVYSCFLDATKAFDCVRFDRLFELLIKRGVNMIDLRALFDLYIRQSTRATWEGKLSYEFHSTNGIRQGSIASPLLYAVYMDSLLELLQNAGIGCWIGQQFTGAICYADDLTLLSPSKQGLQKMIDTCNDYAMDYGVKFNQVKSICCLFQYGKPKMDNMPRIMLAGSQLAWNYSIKHLGNYLCSDLSESKEILAKKGDLVGRLNTLIANMGKAPEAVLAQIFQVQCCHFYGCQAWDLSDSHVKLFYSAWNRSVRRLLGLHYRTHTRFLSHLSGLSNGQQQVFKRTISMIATMVESDNKLVKFIANMALNSCHSIIQRNLRFIAKETGNTVTDILSVKNLNIKKYDCSAEDLAAIEAIRELRGAEINVLEENEINELLTFLSIF